MRVLSRRWIGALFALVLSLPAWPSLLVILVMPPVRAWLPATLLEALWPAAAVVFTALAALPAQSFAGQLFYGSFAPLPSLVGEAALAVHAAMLGLPWLALALLVGWRAARTPRASSQVPPGEAIEAPAVAPLSAASRSR